MIFLGRKRKRGKRKLDKIHVRRLMKSKQIGPNKIDVTIKKGLD